jgi:integrase
MEVRSVRLQDLDFDREQLKVSTRNGKKRPLCSLVKTFNRGLKTYIAAEKTYLFNGQPKA